VASTQTQNSTNVRNKTKVRGAWLRLLHRVAPETTSDWLARRWLTPTSRQAARTPWGERLWVETENGRVACYVKGEGPSVLLLHGWERSHQVMVPLGEALVAGGYRVVAVDLPAHGASDGGICSLPLATAAVQRVSRHFGPWHAVVGHSFGGSVVGAALSAGVEMRAAAFLAAPSAWDGFLRDAATSLGLSPQMTTDLEQAVEKRTGAPMAAYRAERMLGRAQGVAGYVFHSRDDTLVPLHHAEALADALAGTKLVIRDGYGHSRMLRDSFLVHDLLTFLARPSTDAATSTPS